MLSVKFHNPIWSLMWPLYLLLNKILKPEEDDDSVEVQRSGEGHLSLVEDGKCHKEALPRAQFIE